jgi:hypothetical protein
MMEEITLDTKISEILNERPELEQTLLGLSPAFAKLQSPLLRRTVARVTSVKQAASIAGIDASHMLTMLRKAAGQTPMEVGEEGAEAEHLLKMPCPGWFSEDLIVLKFDASQVLDEGKVPMSRILEEVKSISMGEIYFFTTPFFPAPIIEILSNKGYQVWSRRNESIVETYVTK